MPLEHYCFDDISLRGWLTATTTPTDDLKRLAKLVQGIVTQGRTVLAPATIDYVPISDDLSLFDIYSLDFSESDTQFGIDRDAAMGIAMCRGRLTNIEVAIIDAKLKDSRGNVVYEYSQSGTAAIILDGALQSNAFALVSIRCDASAGAAHYLECTSKKAVDPVFLMSDALATPAYVRWLMKEQAVAENILFNMWSRAFPKLLRSDNLSFNRVSGGYAGVRAIAINHLAFLNDHLIALCDACENNLFEVSARAKAIHDIDFSRESTKTRGSKDLMKKRVAKFSDKEVMCELHTKLRPDVNRIHFALPDDAIASGKVLIGMIVDHLPT